MIYCKFWMWNKSSKKDKLVICRIIENYVEIQSEISTLEKEFNSYKVFRIVIGFDNWPK